MSDDFESRLQQQLSISALEMPEKPDRLDEVMSRGHRRRFAARVAASVACVALAAGAVGIASIVSNGGGQSTEAVGNGRDDSTQTPQETLTVDDEAELESDESASDLEGERDIGDGNSRQGANAASFASFDGNCLPAPALGDLSVTDPGKTVIRITSEAELQDAAQNLSPETVLLLAPGTYELTRTLYVQVDDVTIRGESNRCDDVELVGPGMENAAESDTVPDGIWTESANLKVQNLTIRDVYFHAITLNGGAQSPEIYNVRLVDSGEQFIKVNPVNSGEGVNNGLVDYAVISYSNGAPTTDHGGGIGYTQGVDIHAGRSWRIQNSRFENLSTPDAADHLWSPAVLAWNGAADTVVEANVFVNVNRAIAFGLESSRSEDHSGGVIRNNMIVMEPGLYSDKRAADSDGSIIVWNSPGTKVIHNTVITRGNTLKSIELRFNTDGSEVRNNLVDAPIGDRDGAAYEETNNVFVDRVMVDDGSIFRNPENGDLHLVGPLAGVVDIAPVLEFAQHDFDGDGRDDNDAADAGADEFRSAQEPATPQTPPPDDSSAPDETDPAGDSSDPAPNPDPTADPPPTVTPPPSEPKPTGALISKSDLVYEGSFRVPAGGDDEKSTLAYGGAGLGYNPQNNSLFITGHDWHQLTAEISVPNPSRSGAVSGLPQASFLQSLQDVTDGQLPDIAQPREETYGRIGGYLVDGNDLIVSGYDYYDADGSQIRSHLLTNISMGATTGMVSLTDDAPARWLGGAMAVIPQAWRGAFGGDPYMSGLAGISIVSNSSVGPSAATFSRASLTGGDPARLVLGYPLSAPLAGPEAKSDLWNLTSESRGIVFPDGTNSVLYFGTHGLGDYCYGTGAACGDPERSSKGTHAYPYQYQVWAYDAQDLAKVYRGEARPESLRPYDVWELNLPFDARETTIGGAAYDPATGRIFVSQGRADGDQPLIHVFTVR